MMGYLKNRGIRWGIFLFLGILFRFLLDITYSLMYRNYDLFQSFVSYLFTIIITFIALEGIYQVKLKLDQNISWEKNAYRRFFMQWSLGLLVGLFVVFVLRWSYILIRNNYTFVAVVDELIMAALVVVIISVLTVVELSIYLLEKWRFSLAELERFKKENAEFQFESLRSQVNPHFLFNSLNTLSSLIYNDREKAEIFIRELSDVYRYILENRGSELVLFERELKIARSYLFLLGLRFEKNLMVEWQIEKKAESKLIAPLTLQLLIENAVKHNVISRKMPLTLKIEANEDKLTVRNNLQRKEIKEYSSKLGLKNIQSRYSFLTSGIVDIYETDSEFVVKIPLINPS
ncbi:MAG TPA: histidine kinase [Bacteroidales bacterium]|nr:histidine kinase [Bacteroidales bacterium]HPE57893.1 histidine kinase [Bacteroidales bacterium]HRX97192.1 histidine kinase [Bacteroidales bacterium]